MAVTLLRCAVIMIGGAHVLFATVLNVRAAETDQLSKPNFIVILADDLGYADVGFQGCQDIPTPNLDKLAHQGIRCTQGYVSHSFCSPTRAGLMTGRYQQKYGHENNPRYDPKDTFAGLPTREITVANILSEAGYVTGAVGKWHLGAAPHFHPLKRGFQEYFGLIGGGHDYFDVGEPGESREYRIPLQRDTTPEKFDGYLTDVLSDEAAAFVRRHRDKPFFLYLAYNAPHAPLQAPDRYLERVKHIQDARRRVYGAMIAALDDGVGRLCDALAELGLDKRTLIFFLSDNGGPVDVTHASNAPLRGGKGSVYEGGIRVPFVVRWTGVLPAGYTYNEPVISLDIPVTLAEAAGATLPSDREIDGVNLLPYFLGQHKGAPHEALFWRQGGGTSWAVRRDDWKLVKAGQNQELQLFNLRQDISETTDVKSQYPEICEELQQRYIEWNNHNVPPIFESPRASRDRTVRQRGNAVPKPAN
ncbi:sulfatase [Thermogutta sp.]|uniref:sulfatase n=1 Tax=Thermogutta sp. TaxID=1962930 RepID=UPI003C7A7BFB